MKRHAWRRGSWCQRPARSPSPLPRARAQGRRGHRHRPRTHSRSTGNAGEAPNIRPPRSDDADWVKHRSARATSAQVAADELFALDTELRQDVPGNDGWRGNRTWFDDEMASAAFDPAAYLVARGPRSRELVGLCRFWNNQAAPSLGMIGVLAEDRRWERSWLRSAGY